MWRGGLDMMRNPTLAALHCVAGAVLGVLVGFVFYQAQLNTEGAQDRVGAIFFGIVLIGFISFTAVDLIEPERQVCVCVGGGGGSLASSASPRWTS